jgi:hypothetical protein
LQPHGKIAAAAADREFVNIARHAGIGHQLYLRPVQPEAGQRQGRGDIGVERVVLRGLACAALKERDRLCQRLKIEQRLGLRATPGLGRLAAGVDERLEAGQARRTEGVDAADRACR